MQMVLVNKIETRDLLCFLRCSLFFIQLLYSNVHKIMYGNPIGMREQISLSFIGYSCRVGVQSLCWYFPKTPLLISTSGSGASNSGEGATFYR